ncbi:MAG: YihY/virulence factor BrkB family protein [Syntrophobacteraceae bacterium]
MDRTKALLFVKKLWTQSLEDGVTDLAAQLAFYFMLSIFPFLVFAVTLLGYSNIAAGDVLGLLRQVAPSGALEIIESNLHDILSSKRSGLLSFGILGTVWTASGALSAVIRALNRAYQVEEGRSFIKTRALAVLLTLGMVLTILVTLLLPVFGDLIRALISRFVVIPEFYSTIWNVARFLLSSCIMAGAFICIYYLAPNLRLRLSEVVAGAVFAMIGWQFVSLGFSYYLGNFANYSATYGSLGAIIALMIWFYLTGLILILGGELNAVLRWWRCTEHDGEGRPC